MTAVTMRNMTKAYGNYQALSAVTLTLEEGHIYGLAGPVGAGKTTLLRVLAGLAAPDAGELALFGQSDPKTLRQSRKRMGFWLPRESFFLHKTALENLLTLQRLRGYSDREEALKRLEQAGLGREKAETWKISSLSSVEFQKLTLAACLLGDPDLLVLDEPFSGMDAGFRPNFGQTLLEQGYQGRTVLLTSQSLSELYPLATDYIFLCGGKIEKTLSREALADQMAEAGLAGEAGLDTYMKRINGEEELG